MGDAFWFLASFTISGGQLTEDAKMMLPITPASANASEGAWVLGVTVVSGFADQLAGLFWISWIVHKNTKPYHASLPSSRRAFPTTKHTKPNALSTANGHVFIASARTKPHAALAPHA